MLPSPTPFAAIVLAGGASSRMGFDKAFYNLHGETLLQRQLRMAQSIGAKQVFISGRNDADYAGYAAEVLYDDTPACGPLGGIIAGMRAANHPLLLVLAVDMPHITTTFLSKLLARTSATCGIAPIHSDGILEPLAACYPIHLLEEAIRLRNNRQVAPHHLARSAMTNGTMLVHILESHEARQLISINNIE